MQTINIIPKIEADWLTTSEVAKLLGKNARTVQEMGKDGRIVTKPAGNPKNPTQRLYDAKHVAALMANAPEPSPAALRKREARKAAGAKPQFTSANALTRSLKPSQSERALDVVSIVGTQAINHRAEMEMIVSQMGRNFENLLNMVLSSQKAEADANRERLRAEREDARERWEIERRDRLERRRTSPTTAVIAKAAKAGVC